MPKFISGSVLDRFGSHGIALKVDIKDTEASHEAARPLLIPVANGMLVDEWAERVRAALNEVAPRKRGRPRKIEVDVMTAEGVSNGR